MNADTILNLLTVANRIYRGRYGFTGPQDLAETAQAWSHVLPDVTDEEGAQAFKEHLRTSPFAPTTADILDLVKLTRAIGPVLACADCGATDDLIVQDDDETRLCGPCHLRAHGGPCRKSLSGPDPASLRRRRNERRDGDLERVGSSLGLATLSQRNERDKP